MKRFFAELLFAFARIDRGGFDTVRLSFPFLVVAHPIRSYVRVRNLAWKRCQRWRSSNGFSSRVFGATLLMAFSAILLTKMAVVYWQGGIYPAHLTWEWGVQNSLRRIVFLNLITLDLVQPAYCTHFEPTKSATYIPWESNTPRSAKLNSRRTEGIRYLRTNSHQMTFDACLYCLPLACVRLGYPKSVVDTPPAWWSERSRFMQRRHLGGGLGDFYQNQNQRCEVVHMLHIPFATNVPVNRQRQIRKIGQCIARSNP